MARSGRDIGDIPAVKDPPRRAAAEKALRAFFLSYFPETFFRPFSRDREELIALLQEIVIHGGLHAYAMPRGDGKTVISERAVLWAVLNGYRRFPVVVAAIGKVSKERLFVIKTSLECNRRLAEDYPEVCYPIGCLEGIANRCRGQLYRGEPTRIVWKDDRIVLPTIPGSKSSGSAIYVASLEGNIRGLNVLLASGETIRPDLVLLDDPQTRESARSPIQTQQRLDIIRGDVLGLAAPGVPMAALCACTVIEENDLSDTLLNPALHPEWQGRRTQMVYAWPTNEALWSEYSEIWREGFRTGNGMTPATAFYAANRAAMDAGGVVGDEHRHDPGDLSAIQHSVNLKLKFGEAAFAAEYQNRPLPRVEIVGELTADDIVAKINRVPRGTVPLRASRLTAFIDVQQRLLYYVVCGWEDDFTGYVIEYGTYPDQQRAVFTLRDAKRDLAGATKVEGLEGQLYAGLQELTKRLLGIEWPRQDKAPMRLERCFIDAGKWGDVIKLFCRQSAYAGQLTPSHGRYIGARNEPLTGRKKKDGERFGLNWVQPALAVRGKARHVNIDTNFWKSFVYARLATAMGAPGCLSLFGDREGAHRLFAQHLVAEKRKRVQLQTGGREVDEWILKPGRPDNHWFDCLVGAAVAANFAGVNLRDLPPAEAPTRPRQRVSFSEMQRRARERRE